MNIKDEIHERNKIRFGKKGLQGLGLLETGVYVYTALVQTPLPMNAVPTDDEEAHINSFGGVRTWHYRLILTP
jgi:hypothetical protein